MFAVAVGCTSAPAADAAVITFVINGVVGNPPLSQDVGSIVGSFTYDNGNAVLTDVNITTTAGPAEGQDPSLPGTFYGNVHADDLDIIDNAGEFDFTSDDGNFVLSLFLTDGPDGVVGPGNYPVSPDTVSECTADFVTCRQGLAGTIVAPEPATLGLLGLGILGLGLLRRRTRHDGRPMVETLRIDGAVPPDR